MRVFPLSKYIICHTCDLTLSQLSLSQLTLFFYSTSNQLLSLLVWLKKSTLSDFSLLSLLNRWFQLQNENYRPKVLSLLLSRCRLGNTYVRVVRWALYKLKYFKNLNEAPFFTWNHPHCVLTSYRRQRTRLTCGLLTRATPTTASSRPAFTSSCSSSAPGKVSSMRNWREQKETKNALFTSNVWQILHHTKTQINTYLHVHVLFQCVFFVFCTRKSQFLPTGPYTLTGRCNDHRTAPWR